MQRTLACWRRDRRTTRCAAAWADRLGVSSGPQQTLSSIEVAPTLEAQETAILTAVVRWHAPVASLAQVSPPDPGTRIIARYGISLEILSVVAGVPDCERHAFHKPEPCIGQVAYGANRVERNGPAAVGDRWTVEAIEIGVDATIQACVWTEEIAA